MNAVHQLLDLRSASSGPALIRGTDGASVSWAEIQARAGQWQRSGLTGAVGLALADPLEMASHIVAALAAGVVIAPMDPSAPARDTAARARELNLSAFVTHREDEGDDSSPRALEQLRVVDLGTLAPLPGVAGRPALIMASSGSTGKAKIVPLTLEQLTATAEEVVSHLGLVPKERGYSPLPLFHINCIVVGVLSTLIADSTLVLDRRFSRRAFWKRVERHGVTWLNLVPAILAILAGDSDSQPVQAGGVRLARSASAPLPVAVLDRFESRFGIPVVETYGMTEAASQITANPLSATRPGSVGKAAGMEVRVVDDAGEDVSPDVVGQVQIRGRSVIDTYWVAGDRGQLESRPAPGEDGWLATGDVGRMDGDGYLYLIGREGDVINRGGEKVRPREVEDVLLGDTRVRAAIVVGRGHPVVGEEPVAFVVPSGELGSGGKAALAEDLAGQCRRALSGYKRPAVIEVVEKLPAGPTGKVRRAEVVRIANSSESRAPARTRSIFLDLPQRESKPRARGLTVVIDNGVAHGAFADAVATAAPYIDMVKFGWGTAMVTPDIERKFAVLQDHGIRYFFGGTLFEKFVMQDRFDSFLTLCRLCDCRLVEVSNGTVDVPPADKARYIARCAEEFQVLSEVGFKDPGRSDELSPADWANAVSADLEAGAAMVITEARESGKSGICHPDGTPRSEALDAILDSGVDPERLIFEAPTKQLQTHFISLVGPDVNLGNIAPNDVIGLETLRLGLRSDTLFHFEEARSIA